jgi:hypothetical protein
VKPPFIIFSGDPEKERWIWKNDRCKGYSLKRICSATIETECWIWENGTSRNDRSRFHCIGEWPVEVNGMVKKNSFGSK